MHLLPVREWRGVRSSGCEDLSLLRPVCEDLRCEELCCEDLSFSRWSVRLGAAMIPDPCAAALSLASTFHHLAACISRCLPQPGTTGEERAAGDQRTAK